MKKIPLKVAQVTSELITGDKSFEYRKELLGIAGSAGQGIGSIEEMEQRLKVRKALQDAPEEPELGQSWPFVVLEDAEHKALCDWLKVNWRPRVADEAYLQFQKDVLDAKTAKPAVGKVIELEV